MFEKHSKSLIMHTTLRAKRASFIFKLNIVFEFFAPNVNIKIYGWKFGHFWREISNIRHLVIQPNTNKTIFWHFQTLCFLLFSDLSEIWWPSIWFLLFYLFPWFVLILALHYGYNGRVILSDVLLVNWSLLGFRLPVFWVHCWLEWTSTLPYFSHYGKN